MNRKSQKILRTPLHRRYKLPLQSIRAWSMQILDWGHSHWHSCTIMLSATVSKFKWQSSASTSRSMTMKKGAIRSLTSCTPGTNYLGYLRSIQIRGQMWSLSRLRMKMLAMHLHLKSPKMTNKQVLRSKCFNLSSSNTTFFQKHRKNRTQACKRPMLSVKWPDSIQRNRLGRVKRTSILTWTSASLSSLSSLFTDPLKSRNSFCSSTWRICSLRRGTRLKSSNSRWHTASIATWSRAWRCMSWLNAKTRSKLRSPAQC